MAEGRLEEGITAGRGSSSSGKKRPLSIQGKGSSSLDILPPPPSLASSREPLPKRRFPAVATASTAKAAAATAAAAAARAAAEAAAAAPSLMGLVDMTPDEEHGYEKRLVSRMTEKCVVFVYGDDVALVLYRREFRAQLFFLISWNERCNGHCVCFDSTSGSTQMWTRPTPNC